MKANELRVGNWVEWEDTSHEQFQVQTITHWRQNHFINGGLLDDMLPIPLTEEWLIKFGFKESKRVEPARYLFIEQQDYYLHWHQTDGVYLACNGMTGIDPFYFDIEYVHQLQNLYFALCGEELTIKE